MPDIIDLRNELREFTDARDWGKFHTPKNLIMALSVEVSELAEHYQWLNSFEVPSGKAALIRDELADVFIYTVQLADVLGIELIPAAFEKINKNADKYPADLVRGRSDVSTKNQDVI